MRQNRNRIPSKNHKNTFTTLQSDLFSKINSLSSDNDVIRPSTTYGRRTSHNFY